MPDEPQPEVPSRVTQAQLYMLRKAAQAIVNTVDQHEDVTQSEANLAEACRNILARIVNVG